jgi:hypothetical protein
MQWWWWWVVADRIAVVVRVRQQTYRPRPNVDWWGRPRRLSVVFRVRELVYFLDVRFVGLGLVLGTRARLFPSALVAGWL